ncbi:MAG: hypothetical protein ACM359_16045, partial [Bacillota bacterium]
MQDRSTAELGQSPSTPRTRLTARDIQRNVLRDLVTLATECAATEAEIDRRYRATIDDAQKELDRTTWAIEERHRTLKDTIQQKHQDRVNQIESQYQTDSATLNENIKAARQRIQVESKSVERQIKKEFDQAVWLVESLYDGTETQLREEGKQAKEKLTTRLKEIEDKEHDAAAVLLRYGFASPQPTPPPGEDHPAPENPEAIFETSSAAIAQHLVQLENLRLPQLFVGARPHFLGALLCGFVMLVTQAVTGKWEPHIAAVLIAGGITLAILLIAAAILRTKAHAQVKQAYAPLRQALDGARHAA